MYIEEYPVSSQEYESAFFPVDELSFVGAMIKKEAIKKIGFRIRSFSYNMMTQNTLCVYVRLA